MRLPAPPTPRWAGIFALMREQGRSYGQSIRIANVVDAYMHWAEEALASPPSGR
jgi:hypothetical protein